MATLKREMTTITDLRPLAAARGWDYQADPQATNKTEYVDVSRTIPDDANDSLRNALTYSTKFYVRGHKTTDYILEKYWTRLYSVSPERQIQAFSCLIPNVTLVGNFGVARTSENEILTESTLFTDIKNIQLSVVMYGAKPPVALSDKLTWVSLQSYSAGNYSHWLNDCLPRLMVVDLNRQDLGYIVPTESQSFHFELLALLGIPADRIYVPSAQQNVQVEKFLLTRVAKSVSRGHRVMTKRLRDCLWFAAQVEPAHAKRMYISRAQSSRAIVNEADMLPILERYGFEIAFCESLTVKEQIQLFSQASVIAGAHGAGMNNIVFAKPGAQIMEIYNRYRWEMNVHRLAGGLGHQHWHLFADNAGKDQETRVDIEKFERWLQTALPEG